MRSCGRYGTDYIGYAVARNCHVAFCVAALRPLRRIAWPLWRMEYHMSLKSLHLQDFLSYGRHSMPVELGSLNVIIGANGSGKSNFLDAIDLLRAAPCESECSNARAIVHNSGGAGEWIWKKAKDDSTAFIEAVLDQPDRELDLRYSMRFANDVENGFEIREERVEDAVPSDRRNDPHFYCRRVDGQSLVEDNGKHSELENGELDPGTSILAHCKDPDRYPELAWVGAFFGKMRIYREWNFGRNTVLRVPQTVDQPDERLSSDAGNLGLVLDRLGSVPDVKERILDALNKLYWAVDDFEILFERGVAQVIIQEGCHAVPIQRLSDGTLRFLCLLAILCHPDPGPLICIEEPELGMHPDVVATLAEMLVEASEHTQLVVTTHSDYLVDVLTRRPESVFVAQHNLDGTRLTRLEADKINHWLKDCGNSLAELWMSGHIGGLRW